MGHDTARSRGAACSEDAPRRTVAGLSLAPTTTSMAAGAGCLSPPPVSNAQPLSDPLNGIGFMEKSASDVLGARAASSSTRVKKPLPIGGAQIDVHVIQSNTNVDAKPSE